MMDDTPLAIMGVVVQSCSSVLLALFFMRLRRVAPRRGFGFWAIAWLAQCITLSAALTHSFAYFARNPAFGAALLPVFATISVPATLLVGVFAVAGAFEFACPPVSYARLRAAIAASVLSGIAVVMLDDPQLTGGLIIATFFAAFVASPVVVFRAELRSERFPALALAMLAYGVVAIVFQLGASYRHVLWPVDDFDGVVGWTSGYVMSLMGLVVSGALLLKLAAQRVEVIALPATESLALDSTGFAPPEDAVVEHVPPLEAEPVAPVELTAPEWQPVVHVERELRRPPALTRERTATLPLPPLRADGSAAEVMLIDDEAAVRSTLARIFQRGGWPVRDASTGEEALAWLLDVPLHDAPAVILCDFRMPGMDGRAVYAHLERERPELLARLAFITGDSARESARSFISGNSSPIVEKPFTLTEIARAVELVLERSAAGAA